ncbi:MAG: SDR family oxidoreductase [Spirochaetales bacterium]|jgi:NAD(P)-dependent dehydrogenase (short-subunit alcohol dehydrogenase family)|nr:SDR family oxidoreductase [Spirochaetales bacterium]
MIFDRMDFLDAAQGAARWIESLGVETGEGTFWRCQPEESGNVKTDRLDLYRRSAGKIFFFSQLFRATGDEQYLAGALAGARFVMARFDPSTLMIGGIPNSAWTLYGGTAGIAFALLDLSLIPGAGAVGERAGVFARACVDKIRSAANAASGEVPRGTKGGPVWTGEPCVYADGGTILFLLHAAEALWERVMGINVTGVFKMTRAALPVFIQNGTGIIVNIASAAGLSGGQGGAAYTASKHAVIGLTKSITDHYGHRGIRCNAIAPGGIKTNLRDSYGERDPEGFGRVSRFSAFKFEEGEPGEVAEIALFLASPESRLINGAVILADRGWNAY